MAMSRSAGSASFTRRPSMRISPSETSSSPATMRRSVDLPQPDGPTKTTSSPCPTWMSTPFTASAPLG